MTKTINNQPSSTMLKNEQIICIGLPTWEGTYMKSTVQLMTELAKENEVLYVDYPFTYKDLTMGLIGKKDVPIKRMLGMENPLRTLALSNGNLVNVLTLPPVLPTNFLQNERVYDAFYGIGAKKAYKAIKKAMDQLGFKNPILINAFNPFLGVHLAGQFDEKLSLYYCYDEINAAKWCGRHGGRLERELMASVDGVVFSSKPLMEKKKHLTRNSYLVKNGVNFELFNQAVFQKEQMPIHQFEEGKTIIGYLGSLDERLDYQLLAKAANLYPEKLFVFVGRMNHAHGKAILNQLPNVRLMGPQPPKDLPKWVALFDVCLIPFVKNELTAGIYPLKINEYLAAGKQVICTDFGDLEDFSEMVNITKSEKSFLMAIEQSNQANQPELIHERILFAYENSWERRAGQFASIISKFLKANRSTVKSYIPSHNNRWGRVATNFYKSNQGNHYSERTASLFSGALTSSHSITLSKL